MKKTRGEIHEIIKKSYETNVRSIGWSGMHDSAVDKIMKILEEKLKKSENKAWLCDIFVIRSNNK